jgi:PKD repeat protein
MRPSASAGRIPASSHVRGVGHRDLHRRRERSAGQALAEFALFVPAFLLLLLTGIDCGRVFFSWIEVDNAAREAAAYAAGNPTDSSGISAHALQETDAQHQGGEHALAITSWCSSPSGATIDCSTAGGGSGTGNRVTVSVNEQFSFLTPFIGNFFGGNMTLNGSATAAVFVLQANGGVDPPNSCDPPDSAVFSVATSGLTLTVDASASTPNSGLCAISGYNWDWGDGVNAFPPIAGKQATYTYASAGSYVVLLQVTNQAGSKSTNQTVVISAPLPTPTPMPTPTPSPSPSPTASIVCSMSPSFTYTESGNSGKFNVFGAYTGQPAPNTWAWNYGDGTVASGQDPAQHRYSGNGPYTILLTVQNGPCQASTSQVVTP